MKCIYCNSQLASIAYCPGCGADVTLLKRIGRISNLLYNKGLEKASVRDLSGAVSCLKRSLKFNKENTDARNLLGLCYYETGEVVLALCEWVISKNMQPNDNLAEHYMNQLQNNKNQLDAINQSIRKYNQSIEYCRDAHEDMAVMQLKKVVAQNPKLVKAQQLLALLYMKNKEYEKARKMLRKASMVDNTNTTTLRYMSELEEITGKGHPFGGRRKRRDQAEENGREGGTLRYVSGTETIIQPTTFRDSSTVATFINIGLGILLGGAVIWFLAVPASRQASLQQANQVMTDANLKLASGTAQLKDLQDEIDGYQTQVATANSDRDDAIARADSYDELLGVASLYVNGNTNDAVEAMEKVDPAVLEGNAKSLYDNLKAGVGSALFQQYYSAGISAYASGDYTTAAEQLKRAVSSDTEGTAPDHYNALYYLGFAYFNLGDTKNSNKIFNEIIEKYPAQAGQVQAYLTADAQTQNGTNGTQGEAAMNQGQTGTATGTTTGTTGGGQVVEQYWNGQEITVIDDGNQNVQNQQNTAQGQTGTQDGTQGVDQYGQTQTYDQTYGQYNQTQGYDQTYGQTTAPTYDQSQVAWTDPYTGLNYDMYGNLLG